MMYVKIEENVVFDQIDIRPKNFHANFVSQNIQLHLVSVAVIHKKITTSRSSRRGAKSHTIL